MSVHLYGESEPAGTPFSYAAGAYDESDNAFLIFSYSDWWVPWLMSHLLPLYVLDMCCCTLNSIHSWLWRSGSCSEARAAAGSRTSRVADLGVGHAQR